MAKSVLFSIHLNKETKRQCEQIYGALGMTLSAAIRVFMRQSVRDGGFPFDVRIDAPTNDKVAEKEESVLPTKE